MAMEINNFIEDLKDMQNKLSKIEDEEKAKTEYANLFANAIKKLLESAEVSVTALSSEIKVQGSAAAQTNTIPITLVGNDNVHTGGIK